MIGVSPSSSGTFQNSVIESLVTSNVSGAPGADGFPFKYNYLT